MRNSLRKFSVLIFVAIALLAVQLAAGQAVGPLHGYQKAPAPIPEILSAPPTPLVVVSPNADWLLVADRLTYPPIADLSAPMLRLAGLRLDPTTNGRHHPLHFVSLRLVSVQDGKQQAIQLPRNAYLNAPEWSPDGQRFAFTNTTATGIELWVGQASTPSAHVVPSVRINAVIAGQRPMQWMPDGHTLLVQSVPLKRGSPPVESKVPDGPIIQESDGKKAPASTFEDLLQNAHDEDLFDYYATAQLLLVDTTNGRITPVGKPAIFSQVDPSPDGEHILAAQIHRPYSYLLPYQRFPKEVEIWDRSGKLEYKLASLPLEEHIPIEGVPNGPRNYDWVPTQLATLVWTEALDGGDTKAKVPFHDHLLLRSAPFKDQPVELMKTEQRFAGIEWGENGLGLANDYDRNRRWVRTFAVDANKPGQPARLLWERSAQDRYKDRGTPLMKTLANGKRIMHQDGDSIFLAGAGATPKGEFPFLDRMDLQTLKSERLFQCSDGHFENVVAILSHDGRRFLTRYESPTEPPSYYIHSVGERADRRALLTFPDPAPQLRGITKQLVTYKRADGVQLSFTLYLPPNRKPGERLPTIVWAYPLEFNDAGTAGQVSGSPYRFTTITSLSNVHLLLLTQGYAILDSATMPVIGDPETMNNTYVEQVVSSAQAAVDKAVEMGVTDRNRVGVGGHSYGAFMTANLLAHSDIFRAGVARSGAYNRTLTPFGFQSERRTLWEAPEMYLRVSPFMYADKIRHPILLTHGMADDNSGTFPIQSERLYQAIKGNGGMVRYVQLPYEAHGYLARETIEHVLFEMVNWFDKWVKNAPATTTNMASAGGQ
jgi:dipeptidyl aminopeptidase/acylaminoacyl peptidase